MTIGAWIGLGMGICTFIISIGGLIWKMATLASKVEQNEKDINGFGAKLNSTIEKTDAKLHDMAENIVSINISLTKIATIISGEKLSYHEGGE